MEIEARVTDDAFEARETYRCSLCAEPILPGMWWRYRATEHTDSRGNRCQEITRVHAYHNDNDRNDRLHFARRGLLWLNRKLSMVVARIPTRSRI